MKRLSIYILSLVTLIAPMSWAGNHAGNHPGNHHNAGRQNTIAFARVTSATPIYRIVETRTPVQNCWTERVREERPVYHQSRQNYQQAAAGTLVGGLVGSAIGHAIGQSNGHERTGTVIGAVVGASIGNNVGRHSTGYTQVGYRDVERCEVQQRVHKDRVLEGYDVTYRYQGRTYHTRTRNHPGNRIKVALSVRPLEH
ncbi:uncharacterized protein YcfJ [Alteromonadaceae bacterium 2753L.S.0a.02]|nr:uncharacterized protein YcfJ [Alteromonadaceae bacterium 2753L.S.0a.02]